MSLPTTCTSLSRSASNRDIESIDALGEALRAFEGGVFIISHDSRLLTVTNCQMWLMDNQTVSLIEGGYEEYRKSLLDSLEAVCVCRFGGMV